MNISREDVIKYVSECDSDPYKVAKANEVLNILSTVKYISLDIRHIPFTEKSIITKYLMYRLVVSLKWFKHRTTQDILERCMHHYYDLLHTELKDLVYGAYNDDCSVPCSLHEDDLSSDLEKQFLHDIYSRLKLIILTF